MVYHLISELNLSPNKPTMTCFRSLFCFCTQVNRWRGNYCVGSDIMSPSQYQDNLYWFSNIDISLLMKIWDGQLPREKCYHHLGKCTFSTVNVYFLCLQWLVNVKCVCVFSRFKTLPEFTHILYMNPLLQFTGFPTVNKEMYINTLCCLRDAVRRKCPKKWRTNSLFLLHDNAPAHWSVLVKGFLINEQCDNTAASAILSWPSPADFYLFPQLISALKRWGFCDTTDIIKRAMEELKRLSQNVFQECFYYLYSCWQNCIVAQWDYIERNIAQMIIMVCISQK